MQVTRTSRGSSPALMVIFPDAVTVMSAFTSMEFLVR
jgi:hypothetical protein